MPLIHSEISSPYGRYVDELKKGRLAYQFSTAVGKPVFYPRVRCPFSGLDDVLEWRISKGSGTVYSTSVVFPKDAAPYNVALIDMDEGFRLMSRVVDTDPISVKIGLRVHFRVEQVDANEDPIPVFFPLVS